MNLWGDDLPTLIDNDFRRSSHARREPHEPDTRLGYPIGLSEVPLWYDQIDGAASPDLPRLSTSWLGCDGQYSSTATTGIHPRHWRAGYLE